MKITPFFTAASLLFAAGCAIGPDYQKPEHVLPERYPERENAAFERLDAEWWKLFGDATLNALMEDAFAGNQDLSAAVARMEAAEAAAREAGADYFPHIGAEASDLRSRTSAKTASGRQMGSMTSTNRRAALSLNYELDLWGRIRRQNEAARAEALGSRFARDTIKISLAAQVAGAYFTLRSQDEEVAASVSTLQTRKQTLEIVQGKQEMGAASALEVEQSRAAHAAAHAQWTEAARQRALTEHLLGLLIGQPDRAFEKTADALPLAPIPPVGLPSDLLAFRPDVRQAEEALIAANARIGVAKGAWLPSIGLTGLFGNESAALSSLFSAPSTIWNYGFTLALPLFEGGRGLARVDQANALQRAALADYLKAAQSAFRETRDALVSMRALDREEAAHSVQLEAARQAFSLARARYETGYTSFLEVLDSQREFNNATLAHNSVRRAHLLSVIDLFRALGGGWREEDAGVSTAKASSPENS
ncbi:MAG: efflux transporter outer membrane subunit [Zoogloeaceae bacterium]|nr:efflux transporter outer membrane subunit [Zoogloeaceae bacterium]